MKMDEYGSGDDEDLPQKKSKGNKKGAVSKSRKNTKYVNAERFFEQEADEGDSEEIEYGGKSKSYKKDIKDAYYNEGELKKRTKGLDL